MGLRDSMAYRLASILLAPYTHLPLLEVGCSKRVRTVSAHRESRAAHCSATHLNRAIEGGPSFACEPTHKIERVDIKKSNLNRPTFLLSLIHT